MQSGSPADFAFSSGAFGFRPEGEVQQPACLVLVFAITMTFAPSDNADEAAPPAPEGFVGQKQRSGFK
jgi:hypothetical protein